MKKFFPFIFSILILISLPQATVYASNDFIQTSSVYHDGYHIETIITEAVPNVQAISSSTDSQEIIKTKTTYVKDANQNILWYVSITATFTYDEKTSKCTSCSPEAGSNSSVWSIKSCTSSINGNSATATAVAVKTSPLGITQEYTQSVTIQCSPSGEVS